MREKLPLTAVVLAAMTIPIVSLFWRDNAIVTTSFIVISLFTIWIRKQRRDITVFLGAAVLGTLTETVCVYFGAWSYSNPTYIIPMWLPLAWGIAGLISVSMTDYLFPGIAMKGLNSTRLPWMSLVFLVFLASLLSVAWRGEILVSVILLIATIVTLFVFRSKRDVVRYVIGFFIGPAAEIICVYFGAWSYSSSYFLIPLWLPPAWALMNVYLGRLFDYLESGRSSR